MAPLTLFYDARCPLCAREAAAIRRMDRGRGAIRMMHITDPQFDPASIGRTHEQVMARMHALTPDGRVLEGMEAFRQAYKAVGRGWLLAPTGWPLLGPLFDALYRWFARNRMTISRLFGRHDCESGACAPRARG